MNVGKVSKINISTKPKTVWKISKKISGKNNLILIRDLLNNAKITGKKGHSKQIGWNILIKIHLKTWKHEFQNIKKNEFQFKKSWRI